MDSSSDGSGISDSVKRTFLRLVSLSPVSLLMISGPLIVKQKAPVSAATALFYKRTKYKILQIHAISDT
eukprot:8086-Heterococcus_DN1.PRE.7